MKLSNLQTWFLSHTKDLFRQDRLTHFFVGFLLFVAASLVIGNVRALLLVFLIAFIKEVFYDRGIRDEKIEVFDIIYSILPGIILIISRI